MASEDLKPGQKFPTPTPGFGDRVFYETLYRQRPESQIAQEWWVLVYPVITVDTCLSPHSFMELQVRQLWSPARG
jgi:hypothetical protein